MSVQSCCSANLNLLHFWRPRWRRRCRCLSSLFAQCRVNVTLFYRSVRKETSKTTQVETWIIEHLSLHELWQPKALFVYTWVSVLFFYKWLQAVLRWKEFIEWMADSWQWRNWRRLLIKVTLWNCDCSSAHTICFLVSFQTWFQQSFVKLSAYQFLPHLNEKTKPANCWKHGTKLDRETRGRCSTPNWGRKVARVFLTNRKASAIAQVLSYCVNYWLARVLFQMLGECCWLWTTVVFMTSLVYLNSTSDSFPIRSFRVPCTNNSLQRDVSICRFINLLQFCTFSCVQLWCSISKVRFSKSIFTLNGCPLPF